MYIRSHHLRHHLPQYQLSKSLWVAGVLRFMGQAMLLFFLLVYLFTVGFSPPAIFGYGVVLHLAGLLLNHFVIGHLISLIGPRKMMALSNIALIAFAFGLYALPISLPYLYGLAVIHALAIEAYYLSQHAYLVAKTAKSQSTGKQVGGQMSTEPIGAGMLGPLAAGLVAWLWSAQAVNLVAGTVLIISALLAFFLHDTSVSDKHRYSHDKMWSIYRSMISNWRNSVMVAAVGGFYAINEFFALYQALFILAVIESSSNYSLLGVFTFFGGLIGLIATIRAGRKADKNRGQQTLRRSVVVESIISFGRMVIVQFPGWIKLGFVGIHPAAIWWTYESRSIPVHRRAYQNSEKFADAKVEYSVCLENAGAFVRLLIYGVACLLSFFISLSATLLIGFSLAFILNATFLIPLGGSRQRPA